MLNFYLKIKPETELKLVHHRGENLKFAYGMGTLRRRPQKPMTMSLGWGKRKVNLDAVQAEEDFGSKWTIS